MSPGIDACKDEDEEEIVGIQDDEQDNAYMRRKRGQV